MDKDDYIFNILIDDEMDIVMLTVGGFKSKFDRESFANDLNFTLTHKKMELYSKKSVGFDEFLGILNYRPKNVTIH